MGVINGNLGGTDASDGDILTAADVNDTFDAAGYVPVGTILPWAKSFTGVPTLLSDSFVECNGQVLSDAESPLDGETIPDLNGTGDSDSLFLRGATTSGGTGGAHEHDHTVTINGAQNTTTGSNTTAIAGGYTTSTTSNVPPYYEVVMIMRVK